MTDGSVEAASAFQAAVSCHRQGQLSEARRHYERTLQLQPGHVQALVFLAVMALDSEDAAEAIRCCRTAISVDPHCVAAYLTLGQAHFQVREFAAAVADYDRLVAVQPRLAVAHLQRGLALGELQRVTEAIDSLDRAIALECNDSRPHFARGDLLKETGNFAAALASYDQGIASGAADAQIFCNRGYLLGQLGRPRDALDSYDRAIAIDPRHADAWLNRGAALLELGEFQASIDSYTQAVAVRPGYAEAYFGRAFASLLVGDLNPGWRDYEWRWEIVNSLTYSERRSFPQPRWDGTAPLAGKTILVHREQGLGDALQFCRYATLLAARGATVILEVHKPLMALLARLDGVAQVIERGSALPQFDYWCPLLSLPLAFQTRLETIPAAARYLAGDPAKVAGWRARLGARTGKRVGLVWSGGEVHPNDRNRSMSLAVLIGHLPPGMQYLCLQDNIRPRDRDALATAPQLREVTAELRDFSDTAALCECMDVVITIDSSVAHLSGALGKPTWLLLPKAPDWRWLLGRDDSPWYPSVRLYRQTVPGDWSDPLRRVCADLSALAD